MKAISHRKIFLVSDEWSVPLCFTHHRALYTVANEEAGWTEKGVDAKAEALRLLGQSHGIPEPTEVDQPASDDRAPESEGAAAADVAIAALSARSAADVRDAGGTAQTGDDVAAQEVSGTRQRDRSGALLRYLQTDSVIVPDHGEGGEAAPETNAAAE